jgi:predicted glycosyltransferase
MQEKYSKDFTHYKQSLRVVEKLEKNGEKVILSSRKEGYKISERFTGGNENA